MNGSDRHSPPKESAERPLSDDRYAQVAVGEELVIYDRQNHQAWVQSDSAVDTEAMV